MFEFGFSFLSALLYMLAALLVFEVAALAASLRYQKKRIETEAMVQSKMASSFVQPDRFQVNAAITRLVESADPDLNAAQQGLFVCWKFRDFWTILFLPIKLAAKRKKPIWQKKRLQAAKIIWKKR
jgi:hypothetical protein